MSTSLASFTTWSSNIEWHILYVLSMIPLASNIATTSSTISSIPARDWIRDWYTKSAKPIEDSFIGFRYCIHPDFWCWYSTEGLKFGVCGADVLRYCCMCLLRGIGLGRRCQSSGYLSRLGTQHRAEEMLGFPKHSPARWVILLIANMRCEWGYCEEKGIGLTRKIL